MTGRTRQFQERRWLQPWASVFTVPCQRAPDGARAAGGIEVKVWSTGLEMPDVAKPPAGLLPGLSAIVVTPFGCRVAEGCLRRSSGSPLPGDDVA